jgi:tetratricopeptide (TPR) repeat protein
MRAAVLTCALLVLPTRAVAEPSNQALVFYNARVALREDRPADALKLWLLRNSLVSRGEPGERDAEFRSVVWAALGRTGLCPDGLRKDGEGAGLWPLALHNWALHEMTRGPPVKEPAPWDTFEVGRQQRFVSLHDVLDAEELRSVSFFRSACLRPYTVRMSQGQAPTLDLTDRIEAGGFLRSMLDEARGTLVKEKVESLAVIDARIFDLDLVLAELVARRAQREARADAQQARTLGVSRAGADDLRDQRARFPESSPHAAFLRQTLSWRAEDWLTLSRQRRLFLFRQARPLALDEAAVRGLMLGVIDALIEKREGEELAAWVGFWAAGEAPPLRDALTRGDRGARLLELEPDSGFTERSVVALHRGVAYLEEGRLAEALRSFAYALRHAEESRASSEVAGLARRWLSFVLSRYETTDEVLRTLQALVPRQEYNAVIGDLVWRAALRADARSFERVAETVRRGTSFDASAERLRLLARGRAGELATALAAEVQGEPYSVLRFVRQLVEKVEVEDPDVRSAQVPTLRLLLTVLAPLVEPAGGKTNAHARVAAELTGRLHAVLDGLRQLDDSGPGRAHGLSPHSETFAGSIRLAPADALPWPFAAPHVESPSAFTPLLLVPVEWRDARGARVFGWRITE